jgi:hypothetical protein
MTCGQRAARTVDDDPGFWGRAGGCPDQRIVERDRREARIDDALVGAHPHPMRHREVAESIGCDPHRGRDIRVGQATAADHAAVAEDISAGQRQRDGAVAESAAVEVNPDVVHRAGRLGGGDRDVARVPSQFEACIARTVAEIDGQVLNARSGRNAHRRHSLSLDQRLRRTGANKRE